MTVPHPLEVRKALGVVSSAHEKNHSQLTIIILPLPRFLHLIPSFVRYIANDMRAAMSYLVDSHSSPDLIHSYSQAEEAMFPTANW